MSPGGSRRDPDCPECADAKAEAEQKAASSVGDGLQLGDCTDAYKKWADCIETNRGQAKACADVLEEFRACHAGKKAR